VQTHKELFDTLEGTFACDLGIIHNFSDGLYAKQMHVPAGYVVGTHTHKYSHLSILAKGKVIVRTDASEKLVEAPACLEIEKGIHHSIEALEDAVWFCIHATNETDVDMVDQVLIEEK
jgi:quercetin dioxygenase-like cupin family protein